MKDKFFEYYRYDDNMLNSMMKDAIIVLDTNVLLDIYRYSKKSRDKFFEVIESIKDRIWLPYQVGLEFLRNRPTVINKKAHTLEQLKNDIIKNINSIINDVKNPDTQQYKLIRYEKELQLEIENYITQAREQVKNIIDSCQTISDELMSPEKDEILGKITQIYSEKVKNKFTDDELKKIYEEGKIRFANKIPPGYADNDKPEPERYGDLIVWYEVIEHSKTQQADVLLITSDKKEDWWNKIGGKTIGPRPELLREFYDKTKRYIYLYTTDNFIHYVSDTYKIKDTSQLEEDTNQILNIRNSYINKKRLVPKIEEHNNLVRKYASNIYKNRYLKDEHDHKYYKRLISAKIKNDSVRQIEELVSWFYDNYNLPTGIVPRNRETGEYEYIHGGPYCPSDELAKNFPNIDDYLIILAAQQIVPDG